MIAELSDGRLLARNAIMNLLGQSAPIVVAVLAIPILIKSLGTDRFGILTLAWVVVGYFSLFDVGLGRALTKLVAEKMGKGQTKEIPGLIWTALALMCGLGIVGSGVLILLTPRLVESILNIPLYLRDETRTAFYILAVSIPFVIVTTGLCGVLEAHQRFDLVNAVRVPTGFFMFLGPLIMLFFSKRLVALVSILVVGRVVGWIVHIVLCFRVVPAIRQNICAKGGLIGPLLSFGGWLTVSNIIGPLMLYSDRFFIASMISITSVAYYTTPYDVLTKLLIIPTAILGVMFPAFTREFTRNTIRTRHLYHQTMKYMPIIMVPIVLLIVIFSEQGLSLWIDADFARKSFRVAQLLGIGVLINSFGLISQSLVQASGRPDITAKLHLIELPLYLVYLKYLLASYGINGAACAWGIRVTISAVVLAFLANRILKEV